MAKGLFFYKLISPYTEDVTKNCKLTINEIDSNFLVLKDADIKKSEFDEETNFLVLTRNNGETLAVDLSPLVDEAIKKLSVSYDITTGKIVIRYGDEVTTIDGLVTEMTLEECKKVITDGTILGNGTYGAPLGIDPLELTGQYKPAISFIDMTTEPAGELPAENVLGDRYVTLEKRNMAGYLYDFTAVQQIEQYLNMLNNGWRIPTKEDWDSMLNAIEICDEARNHTSTMANVQLGQLAGKFLKSKDEESHRGKTVKIWKKCGDVTVGCCGCNDTIQTGDSYTTVTDEDGDTLNVKDVSPSGIDSYGFRVLPTGYHDGCKVQYYCGEKGGLWTNTISQITDVYVKRFDANKTGVVQIAVSPLEMHGLRLVKDYDGNNFRQAETISGITYNTVMMPTIGAEHGYTIWTADNFASKTDEGTYTEVGDCLDELVDGDGLVYYMNYWDGVCWRKKPLEEGDSIVLNIAYTDGSGHTSLDYEDGLVAVHDVEFRIIDGVLVAVNDILFGDVVSSVENAIGSQVNELRQMLDDESDERNNADVSIQERIDKVCSLVFNAQVSDETTIGDLYFDDDRLSSATSSVDADKMLSRAIDDNSMVVAAALNDLNTRLIELSGNSHDERVDDVIRDLDALEDTVDNLSSGLADVRNVAEDSANDIRNIESGMTDIQNDISELADYTADAINGIDSGLTNVESGLTEVTLSVESLAMDADTLKNEVSGLTSGLTELSQVVLDDELVVSAALNDLNDRVVELEDNTVAEIKSDTFKVERTGGIVNIDFEDGIIDFGEY